MNTSRPARKALRVEDAALQWLWPLLIMVRLRHSTNPKGSRPPPQILTPQQLHQKQRDLTLSLREAETKQLTTYLKNRTSLVDEEIDRTREKLSLSLGSSTKSRSDPRSPGKAHTSELSATAAEAATYQKEEYQFKYLLKRLSQCRSRCDDLSYLLLLRLC
jgi:hypothetical protein